jgi:hypothetical protein
VLPLPLRADFGDFIAAVRAAAFSAVQHPNHDDDDEAFVVTGIFCVFCLW